MRVQRKKVRRERKSVRVCLATLLTRSVTRWWPCDSNSLLVRLAGVRFGSGSGVMSPNLNLHLEVRFRYPVNLNKNQMFRFEMFGSCSNQCYN